MVSCAFLSVQDFSKQFEPAKPNHFMPEKFQFELDRSAKKFECPGCGKKSFVKFKYTGTNTYVEGNYGRCDHENSCGSFPKPWEDEAFKPQTNFEKVDKPEAQVVRPAEAYYNPILNSHTSNFHQFCRNMLKISERHFALWYVGTYYSKTVFGYANREKAILNLKFVAYTPEGKRDKSKDAEGNLKNFPHYLGKAYLKKWGHIQPNEKDKEKNWQDFFQFERCFYGLHLWDPEKPTCIVESEKTAFLASFFFPGYNWLATGGNNGLKFEQFGVFRGYEKPIVNLTDNDKAGAEKSKTIQWLHKLSEMRPDPEQIRSLNIFTDKPESWDLADAIIYDGYREEDQLTADIKGGKVIVPGKEEGAEEEVKLYLSSMVTLYQEKQIPDICDTLYIMTNIRAGMVPELEEFAVIGVPKLDDLYEGLSKRELKQDIYKLIRTIDPHKIVLMAGPEVLHLKFDKHKDLALKSKYWFNQVTKFRDLMNPFLHSDKEKERRCQKVFFRFIKPDYYGKAAHCGELLANYPKEQETIKEGMLSDYPDTKYFHSCAMANEKQNKLSILLGRESEAHFYDAFRGEKIIGSQEFIWNSYVYQLDSKKKEIKRLRHMDADMYMWVGDKTVKMVWKELSGGNRVRQVVKYGHERLSQKYGKEFLQDLDEVDGFTTEPDNFHYEPFVTVPNGSQSFTYFNMYQPLIHSPKPGKIDTTLKYLQHVFPDKDVPAGDKTVNFYTLALDWLTILLRHPKQFLPVIGLISKAQQTGKTTFMDWLQVIYGTNAVLTTMESYLAKFNSHTSFKLLICIDEFQEAALEKHTAKNKFKNQATAKNMMVEFKGIDTQTIPNYAKVVFATNSEKPLNLEEEDVNRFWIHPVQSIKKADRDPHLLDKMKREIPAFLDFLANRKIVYPKVSRMWFDPELFKTEYFMQVVDNSRLYHFEMVENYIKETFLTYNLSKFCTNPKYILEMLYSGRSKPKYPISEMQVKEVLAAHGYNSSDGRGAMHIPISWERGEDGSPQIKYYRDRETNLHPVQRYYSLNAQDWLSEAELEELAEMEAPDLNTLAPDAEVVELTAENMNKKIHEYINLLPEGKYVIDQQVEQINTRFKGETLGPIKLINILKGYIFKSETDRAEYHRIVEFNSDFTMIKVKNWTL